MIEIGAIVSVQSLTDLAELTVQQIVEEANKAISDRGRFMIALSGGRTPQNIYRLLSDKYRNNIDWRKVYLFFSDERCVNPENENSNYGMVKNLLIDKVPGEQVFRMEGENPDPAQAAANYENTIRKIFSLRSDEIPVFDFMLLGIGVDGHVASLFPGSLLSSDENKLVISGWVQKLKANRISLSLNVLNNSRKIVFIASGREKMAVLDNLTKQENSGYPVAQIDFNKTNSTWIITD
ncbi:6-phosphogluconolactonase [candidate division KSB1 bacterium]|nr:6-phosphogluconolactonase [candidate division KSB1 bacterium]